MESRSVDFNLESVDFTSCNFLDMIIFCYAHLHGLTRAFNIVYARDLFSHLSSKGVQPDVITYNIMIDGLCHHGLIIEAEKLLREMREKGCPPDGWISNIIIRGLLKNNETSWGMGLNQEMLEWVFSADVFTMELIAGFLCKDVVDPAFLPLLKVS
ncbi:PREDICTED: pentatricopeptide repeat-containing protein At3g22470, mitochondrial-like [Fragaria vesca subsp. vesca]